MNFSILMVIFSLTFNAINSFALELPPQISTDGTYLLRYNDINEKIAAKRNKIRKVSHPNCSYDKPIQIPEELKKPISPSNEPIVDPLVTALFPAYGNLEYSNSSASGEKYLIHNIIVHSFSSMLDSIYGCDYPVGDIVSSSTRSMGNMPITYPDEKYGSQTLNIPLYLGRNNTAEYFTDEIDKNGKEQGMYSGKDFLGKQYFKVIPTDDPKSVMLSVCSVHPGTKIWGDAVSGSYIAYYKPHRVRHDDISTAWFTINPGKISFSGVRICTLSKMSIDSKGVQNVEVLAVSPKFKGVEWTGFSAVVDKVKSETWLGNLGGVVGFVVGTLLGNPVGGWAMGQSLGYVAEKTVILDIINKKVQESIDKKMVEYLDGKGIDEFAEKITKDKIIKAGYVGNILKGSILTPVLQQSFEFGKTVGGELLLTPNDRMISRCEEIINEKISRNTHIPDVVKNGLPLICRSLGNSVALKVSPFNKIKAHKDAGCYDWYVNYKQNTKCAIETKAKLEIDPKFEDEIKALFATMSQSLAFDMKSQYNNLSPKINSLITKLKDKQYEVPFLTVKCPKVFNRSNYSKCRNQFYQIKADLERMGYSSKLKEISSTSGDVVILNPFKDLVGVLK